MTHLHPDHLDEAAKDILPKYMKMFVQNEEDAKELRESGFKSVQLKSFSNEKGISSNVLIPADGEVYTF